MRQDRAGHRTGARKHHCCSPLRRPEFKGRSTFLAIFLDFGDIWIRERRVGTAHSEHNNDRPEKNSRSSDARIPNCAQGRRKQEYGTETTNVHYDITHCTEHSTTR